MDRTYFVNDMNRDFVESRSPTPVAKEILESIRQNPKLFPDSKSENGRQSITIWLWIGLLATGGGLALFFITLLNAVILKGKNTTFTDIPVISLILISCLVLSISVGYSFLLAYFRARGIHHYINFCYKKLYEEGILIDGEIVDVLYRNTYETVILYRFTVPETQKIVQRQYITSPNRQACKGQKVVILYLSQTLHTLL